MKFVFIFHANLNYSHLDPAKQLMVCQKSYEGLFDFFDQGFPEDRWCFEASGFTIDYIAKNAPNILKKMRASCAANCELLGSPYAHSILTNFPYEDGLKSLQFAIECYREHLGITPTVAWNPEGAWMSDIPKMFTEAGYKAIVCDWDSYIITEKVSNWKDGRELEDLLEQKKCFPPIPQGYEKSLYSPVEISPELKGIGRTDTVSMVTLKYFLGEIELEQLLSIIDQYITDDGYLVIFAEDAEYVGTTAWYELKYKGIHRFFEDNPGSFDRLEKLVVALKNRGELATASDVLDAYPVSQKINIKDGLAWHHQKACYWAQTPSAVELDKECDEVRELIKTAEQKTSTEKDRNNIKQAWWCLINAENSDGRWPKPPQYPADFNIKFCRDMLQHAKQLLTD